jgi:hypothetical protein
MKHLLGGLQLNKQVLIIKEEGLFVVHFNALLLLTFFPLQFYLPFQDSTI